MLTFYPCPRMLLKCTNKWVAVDLGTHCNVWHDSVCCVPASNIESQATTKNVSC